MGWAWHRPQQRQGQHRRVRRLERRADESDRGRAELTKRVTVLEDVMMAWRAPMPGGVPAELTRAVRNRSPEVELVVGGEELIACLDTGKPGDVTEIWQAVTRLGGGKAAS